MFGKDSVTDDKYLALGMLGSRKAAASNYLMATLESATPEIRHLFSNFCTQAVQSHEALTNLAIQKGWYSAYGDTKNQLMETAHDSFKVLENQS